MPSAAPLEPIGGRCHHTALEILTGRTLRAGADPSPPTRRPAERRADVRAERALRNRAGPDRRPTTASTSPRVPPTPTPSEPPSTASSTRRRRRRRARRRARSKEAPSPPHDAVLDDRRPIHAADPSEAELARPSTVGAESVRTHNAAYPPSPALHAFPTQTAWLEVKAGVRGLTLGEDRGEDIDDPVRDRHAKAVAASIGLRRRRAPRLRSHRVGLRAQRGASMRAVSQTVPRFRDCASRPGGRRRARDVAALV